MASSPPTSFRMPRLPSRQRASRTLRVRAECSPGDEGQHSMSIVDANMGMLKERIGMMRMEERLEAWCSLRRCNYSTHGRKMTSNSRTSDADAGDDERVVAEYCEIAELAAGVFGLAIVGCTLCLFLVSFLVHLG